MHEEKWKQLLRSPERPVHFAFQLQTSLEIVLIYVGVNDLLSSSRQHAKERGGEG